MMSTVSVVIPVYNTECYLEKCIRSVLTQQYCDYEIILVDDGSKDNSGQICDQYADLDSRIRVVHKTNGGVSSARNTALSIASGEYVVFIDSDDMVSPYYLKELMEYSEFDFVTSGYHWQKNDLSWETRTFNDQEVSINDLKAYPSRYIGFYYFGSPWARLMKMDIIRQNRILFNESVSCGEDSIFIFEYLQYVKTIKIMPLCGYYYHYHSDSLANRKDHGLSEWRIMLEQKICCFFKPYNTAEQEYIDQHRFNTLSDILKENYRDNNEEELYSIFTDPFFMNVIIKKKKRGNINEKVLVYSMIHKNYSLYDRFVKINAIIRRIRRKAKQIIGIR